MRSTKNISRLVRNVLLAISCIVVVIVGIFSISSELIRFNKDSERLKASIIEEKKIHIKHQVETAISGIDFLRMNIESDMRDNIKYRIDEAYKRLVQVYNYYNLRIPSDTLKRILKEVIRYDSFFNGRGYFFIFDENGIEILFPPDQSLEGKSFPFENYEDGVFPVKNVLNTLKTQDSTFMTYRWKRYKMNDERVYNKTSYFRKLPFYNWVLGTGDYQYNIEEELQEKAIEKIKTVKYDEHGYIFVNKFDGTAIIIKSDKYKEGDNIIGVTDSDGVKVFEEELKIAKQYNGGYLSYKWYDPILKREKHNISFIKSIPEWRWMLGAFTDTSQIDRLLSKNKASLYNDLLWRCSYLVLVLVGLVLCILLYSSRIKNKIEMVFQAFFKQLKIAINNNIQIDTNQFLYEENIALSKQTNEILEQRNYILQELKNREKFLQTLIDTIPITIYYKDTEGRYVGCNYEYTRFIGKKKDEIIGKGLYEIFRKEEADILKKADDELFETKGVQVYDSVMTAADGSSRNVNFHNTVYFDDEGVMQGMLGVMIDITDRVNNEQKLLELNNTKDRLFSIIAHDLKNPFSSIMGILDVLIDEYNDLDDKTRMEYLLILNKSSKNLFKLLTNLLEWSTSQSSSIKFEPINISLKEIIFDELAVLKEQADVKNILVKVNSVSNPVVRVDRNMISTVFRNLISNAIKFTKEGGEININIEESEKKIIVSIKDNGVGIPEEIIKRLFCINEKVSTIGTNKEIGTGLGLILCKEFIDKHNGLISVISKEGEGSVFKITLFK